MSEMISCRGCGTQIHVSAKSCPKCGATQEGIESSDKPIIGALLLCFFLGLFGAHRFFVGKYATAVLQILTLGGLGIWTTVDFVFIVIGRFTDKKGRRLTQWT